MTERMVKIEEAIREAETKRRAAFSSWSKQGRMSTSTAAAKYDDALDAECSLRALRASGVTEVPG